MPESELIDTIESIGGKLALALNALEEIKTYGYRYSGNGYSCAVKAEKAINNIMNGEHHVDISIN